jgi:hypothetical protein
MNNLVWYACYGSNILFDRFKYYILGGVCPINRKEHKGCSDKTLPLKDMPIIIPHQMYFGNCSPSWDNKGVSFIDINKPSVTTGRAYLITEKQFDEIHIQEGKSWYDKVVLLGEFGRNKVKTFTHSTRFNENAPSPKYLDVIKLGMTELFNREIINIEATPNGQQ